jgi:hypothetical protein
MPRDLYEPTLNATVARLTPNHDRTADYIASRELLPNKGFCLLCDAPSGRRKFCNPCRALGAKARKSKRIAAEIKLFGVGAPSGRAIQDNSRLAEARRAVVYGPGCRCEICEPPKPPKPPETPEQRAEREAQMAATAAAQAAEWAERMRWQAERAQHEAGRLAKQAEQAEIERTLAAIAERARHRAELEALAAFVEDVRAGRVKHLTADDLPPDGEPLDVERLQYVQTDRAYWSAIWNVLRGCKTRTHKPPSEKIARQWLAVELVGSREAARILGGLDESTVRRAHDKVDMLIRSTPGAPDEIDGLLADAEAWRETAGLAGAISTFMRAGENYKIVMSSRGIEATAVNKGVDLHIWGTGPEAETKLSWADLQDFDASAGRRVGPASSDDGNRGWDSNGAADPTH